MTSVSWLFESASLVPHRILDFPRGIEFIWKIRKGLDRLDCATEEGRIGLYIWWAVHGRQDYPSFEWYLRDEDEQYLFGIFERDIPVALKYYALGRPDLQVFVNDPELGFERYVVWWLSQGLGEPFPAATSSILLKYLLLSGANALGRLPIPPHLSCLFQIHDGLKGFDCKTEAGRFHMYAWWAVQGRQDYPSFEWNLRDEDEQYLFGIFERDIPVALKYYALGRPDLQVFVNDPELGFERYVVWWLSQGLGEPFPAATQDLLIKHVATLERTFPWDGMTPSPVLEFIWRLREDLRNAFNLAIREDRVSFLNWWENVGRKDYPDIQLYNDNNRSLPELFESKKEKITILESKSDPILPITISSIIGINIVGFASSILGIGEDARMASEVVRAAGFAVTNSEPKLIGPPKNNLDLMLKYEMGNENYPISIFCLPPIEMIRMGLESPNVFLNSQSYKVGAWPWELPNWPQSFNGIVNLVDEIWAPSAFVANSFSSLTDTRISYCPTAVEIPEPSTNLRIKYHLPLNDFLYYIMFDGNSWLSRKNPIAGVKAFRKAFSESQKGIGLVIKAMNVKGSEPMWEEIVSIAAKDKRIHIISDVLARQEVVDLMASCDAYISLHRSEGFGRIITEAMLLGQPTVTTNFSGNTDYCNKDTSFMVEGELVELKRGDYIFTEGQYWCNPDIECAANQLCNIIESSTHRLEIAENGRRLIREKYSIQAVSAIFREKIIDISKFL